jgi:putative hydroxymethylpyrimidine transport system permease protein
VKTLRPLALVVGLLLAWQALVSLSGVPAYILPGPLPVARALLSHAPVLAGHLGTTLAEILLGLVLGTLFGSLAALVMILSPLLRRWMLPVLVASQAIPVFALAPILVLWLGYGMASKVGMAVLIIFFPVASAFFSGMQRTDKDLLDLARIMGARPSRILSTIVIPSALPAFAAGLRVATAVAPIGAVVGEWVGSSAGLGFYMLHANARMQIDVMFAALTILAAVSLALYFLVDRLLDRLVFWQPRQGIQ